MLGGSHDIKINENDTAALMCAASSGHTNTVTLIRGRGEADNGEDGEGEDLLV